MLNLRKPPQFMDAFYSFSTDEQSHYNRLLRLQRYSLRLKLQGIKNSAISELGKREYEYLTSLPYFENVEEPIRNILTHPFLKKWYSYLELSIEDRIEAKSIETKITEIKTILKLL